MRFLVAYHFYQISFRYLKLKCIFNFYFREHTIHSSSQISSLISFVVQSVHTPFCSEGYVNSEILEKGGLNMLRFYQNFTVLTLFVAVLIIESLFLAFNCGFI